MPRALPLFVVLGTTAVLASPAAAADGEPVRLDYVAPPSCPDAASFVEEVRARSERFTLAPSGEVRRTFEVRIDGISRRFRGSVRLVDAMGTVSTRTVDGASCQEVAGSLALVVAISVDPRGRAAAAPSPSPEAPPAPRETPSSPPESPVASAPPAPPESPRALTPRSSRTWHLEAGVSAFVQGLAAPTAVLGDAAFVGFAIDTHRVFSPSIRLGAAHAESGAMGADPGEVHLNWTVARATACPLRWPAAGHFGARPCLTADLGALSASAAGVAHEQSHVRFWGTVGTLAALEWQPLSMLVLSAEVSLSVPLQRDRFFIAPTPIVYRAPLLVPSAGLVMAVRFP